MDLLGQIKKNLDPTQYNIPQLVWNGLIINSRIRFHSFFRHQHHLEKEEILALSEYRLSKRHFKECLSLIIKYVLLKQHFKDRTEKITQRLSGEKIILLKTFAYKSSFQNGNFKDPFFHSFTDRLSRESNHLVIIDPLMTRQETKKLLEIQKINTIPWFVFLNFFDFIKAFCIQLQQYFFFHQKNVSSWNKELKQEILHPTTFHHLLFYFAFKKITNIFSIERFILTFENNSWEKMAMQAFRENSPKTIMIGYQHSVIPESALGMRFLPWEISQRNLPDMIYTTGPETQNILSSFNPQLPIPINALCALRYDYLYKMNLKNGPFNKNILVALEAIVEAKDLINLVLDLKEYFVEHELQVTFRFHPAMSYDFFKPNINSRKLESFATVSSNPLIDDLQHSDCVIYWGSTVSLESYFIGNALINFNSHFPLSHDPLYRSNHLKSTIETSQDLIKALDVIYHFDLSFINKEREAARSYIQNYFVRPKDEHFNTLLGFPS